MKRRALTILALLLAGAVVNVAIAWGVFYSRSLLHFPPVYSTKLETTEAADLLTRHIDVPVVHVDGGEDSGVGVWMAIVVGYYEKRGGPPQVAVYLTESGWPVKTMQGRVLQVNGKMDSHWITSHFYIPLRPIWPGFAVNTIFYAAVLCVPFCGLFALRRLIRRRRGLCPACGYDLRHAEHEGCPECGTAYA